MIKIDLTGKVYGDLKVLRIAVDEPGKKKKWLCECKCGALVEVAGSNLVSGHTTACKQCGLKKTAAKRTIRVRGTEKLYQVWNTMRNRCSNPNTKSYSDYGARGVKVCHEWGNSKAFIQWALDHGYKPGLEIDRIDTNGDYCPENCRWIPRIVNANNKRSNVIIEYNGETHTAAEWARILNVNYKNLMRNLSKGDSFEEAVRRIRENDRSHRRKSNVD